LIGAILACCISAAVGFHAGSRWAPGPILGALMGIVLGAVVSVVYFAIALWVGETWHILDPRKIGLMSAGLVVAGALVGAIAAWFGYRKSLGAKLF
jgi:ABC-type transporter Mla maintaining outer membrane lipid asymmetry permease subunit MlaE